MRASREGFLPEEEMRRYAGREIVNKVCGPQVGETADRWREGGGRSQDERVAWGERGSVA